MKYWPFLALLLASPASAQIPFAVDTGMVRIGAGFGEAIIVVVDGVSLPGHVIDLTVMSVTETSITLGWTTVDNGRGEPADYALRVMQGDSIDWEAAEDSQVIVQGNTIGEWMEFTSTGFEPGSTYQFQMAAYRLDP